MHLVIVDCNGTMFDDMDINLRAIREVCVQGGLIRLPDDAEGICSAYFRGFDGDTLKFYRAQGVCLEPNEIGRIYRKYYVPRMNAIPLFDGVHETFTKIRDNHHTPMALVTSNSEDLVTPLFVRFDLYQYFPPENRIFLAKDKSAAIGELCRRYLIPPHLACYVGDMPCDMRHAHKASVVAIQRKDTRVPDKFFEGDAKPDYPVASYAELLDLFYYI